MSGHVWPVFDLRLRTPRLELRFPTDDDMVALAAVARAGIHDPAEMPFLVPWTDIPSPEFERQLLQHMWGWRANWKPANWALGMAVIGDEGPMGIQLVVGRDFAIRRVVITGSWLGQAFQRRGYGTEMRAAVLWLAFEGLGAAVAESGAVEGNEASRRISEKLGYEPNGIEIIAPRGTPVVEQRLRLTRERWRRDITPVTVEGLEPCLPLFGLGGPDGQV